MIHKLWWSTLLAFANPIMPETALECLLSIIRNTRNHQTSALFLDLLVTQVTDANGGIGHKVGTAGIAKDLSAQPTVVASSKDGKGQFTRITLFAKLIRHPSVVDRDPRRRRRLLK